MRAEAASPLRPASGRTPDDPQLAVQVLPSGRVPEKSSIAFARRPRSEMRRAERRQVQVFLARLAARLPGIASIGVVAPEGTLRCRRDGRGNAGSRIELFLMIALVKAATFRTRVLQYFGTSSHAPRFLELTSTVRGKS